MGDHQRQTARRLALGLAALALTIWVLGSAPRGFLSGDSGVKLAQAHALWRSGYMSRALPYDWALDPDERWAPYRGFTRDFHGRSQGSYSLSFTAMSAPFIGLLGMPGTLLPGLLGGLAILLGVDGLLGRMGARAPTRVAAAVFTVGLTPILFYSAQLAEHTPSVGLAVIALAQVVPDPAGRTRPLLAGALVALAATMRPECYLSVATVGLALAARPDAPLGRRAREGALYLAGALAILLVYWGLNLRLSGTWDPLVESQTAVKDHWLNVKRMLIGETRGDVPGWPFILAAAGALGLALPPRLAARAPGLVARAVVGLALVWLAWGLGVVASGRTLTGTFSVTPFAVWGLCACAWRPRWRQVWLYGILTLAAIVILSRSNDAGGLQLGARLTLPALPALISLAAASMEADLLQGPRVLRAAPVAASAALAALTVAMFARALPPAHEIAAQGELAARAAAAMPGRVVIARRWWEAQIMTPTLLQGKELYLTRDDSLKPIFEALATRGDPEVILINEGPIEMTLDGGARVHTRQTLRAWLELNAVEISPGARAASPSR